MPAVETAYMMDDAVLWPAAGTVDSYGKQKMLPPVQLRVKWLTKFGVPPADVGDLVVKAVVGLKIDQGAILWPGILADWTGSGQVYQVTAYNETGDLKGRNVRRTIMAVRMQTQLETYVGSGGGKLPIFTGDGSGTFTAPTYSGSGGGTLPLFTGGGHG